MQNAGPPLREAVGYLKNGRTRRKRGPFEAFAISRGGTSRSAKPSPRAQFADAKATLDRLRQTLKNNRARFVQTSGRPGVALCATERSRGPTGNSDGGDLQ